MTAVRILVLVLGLAAVAFAAKYALQGTASPDGAAVTQPARQLDNVRQQVRELEVEQQRAADRADVKE
jgi:hypothetical protein